VGNKTHTVEQIIGKLREVAVAEGVAGSASAGPERWNEKANLPRSTLRSARNETSSRLKGGWPWRSVSRWA